MERRVTALLGAAEENLRKMIQSGKDCFPEAMEMDILSIPVVGEDGASI